MGQAGGAEEAHADVVASVDGADALGSAGEDEVACGARKVFRSGMEGGGLGPGKHRRNGWGGGAEKKKSEETGMSLSVKLSWHAHGGEGTGARGGNGVGRAVIPGSSGTSWLM